MVQGTSSVRINTLFSFFPLKRFAPQDVATYIGELFSALTEIGNCGVFNFLFLHFHIIFICIWRFSHNVLLGFRWHLLSLKEFFLCLIFIIGFGLFPRVEGAKIVFVSTICKPEDMIYFEELKQIPARKPPWENYNPYINL